LKREHRDRSQRGPRMRCGGFAEEGEGAIVGYLIVFSFLQGNKTDGCTLGWYSSRLSKRSTSPRRAKGSAQKRTKRRRGGGEQMMMMMKSAKKQANPVPVVLLSIRTKPKPPGWGIIL
jgi:hypothetical protein